MRHLPLWGSTPKPSELFAVLIYQSVTHRIRVPGTGIRRSILPEVIETVGGKLGVEDRVLDVFVPQIVLDGTSVLAVVGKLEPGRMP